QRQMHLASQPIIPTPPAVNTHSHHGGHGAWTDHWRKINVSGTTFPRSSSSTMSSVQKVSALGPNPKQQNAGTVRDLPECKSTTVTRSVEIGLGLMLSHSRTSWLSQFCSGVRTGPR